MDCSMLGFPVLNYLPEFAQIQVYWAGDAIYQMHPLPLAFHFAFNLSQHQGLFQWVGSLHQVDKELELQHQFFQWIFWVDFLLGLTGLISLQYKGLSRIFSSTTVQRHQFFDAQPSLWSSSHICTWLIKKHSFVNWLELCWKSDASVFLLISNTFYFYFFNYKFIYFIIFYFF